MNQIIRRMGLCFAMLMFLGRVDFAFAVATEAGMVVNMEGSVVAKGAEGTLRPLATGGKVFAGDMLFTGKDGYARVKFADGGVMSLRPHTQFKIDGFNFDEKEPGKDSAAFNLVKGGLRAVSGLVGKRGDPDSYAVKTHAATIGIRGTQYGVQLCKGDCADVPTPTGQPPDDGLHVDVSEGAVMVKNSAGTQLVNAGQYAYVQDANAAPISIPPERGIRVDIPARINIDKVRGLNSGGNGTGGGATGTPTNHTPNVCPAP
jgi:hypothetical protein